MVLHGLLAILKTRHLHALKALPHVTISSTMVFNVAKIASARASSTISLTKSLRVAGPLVRRMTALCEHFKCAQIDVPC